MTFTDVYLRADTEADLKAALPWALWGEEAPEGVQAGDWKQGERFRYALSLIGPVVTTSAVMSEDGETVVTPAVIDTGFHANLRLIDGYSPDIPAEVVVTPSSPSRVFA